MYSEVSSRVQTLKGSADPALFSGRRVGLEKETLRIDCKGSIAQTDHPSALGSALCNRRITTDFSEALLEMVTPPCDSIDDAMDYLRSIHQFILPRLENGEGLWNTSMPCILRGDDSIRIGLYGQSHNGVMKHVYRRGLGLRYGKRMQAIAGIHFNFSLPNNCFDTWQQLHTAAPAESHSLSTEGYFHMMRNFMRVGWLVPYLFGASPAICQTFLPSGFDSDLDTFNKTTRFAPHGTSLRMGEIGYRYREDAPIDLTVRHDHFSNYVNDVLAHVTTVHPAYDSMGIHDEDGAYQQLNANKLQIENEFYSSVRPKQIPDAGEMPILALQRAGIQYLELRSVDVNLYDPIGMHKEQLCMLEMLMLFCWLSDGGPLLNDEMQVNTANVKRVAHRGREPGLTLTGPNGDIALAEWGKQVLHAMEPLAEWLDAEPNNAETDRYQSALALQIEKMQDPSLTPSARIVDELQEHGSFFEMVMHHSTAHQQTLERSPINQAMDDMLAKEVTDSVDAQVALEEASTDSFDTFLTNYFSQLDQTSSASS